MKKLLSIFLVGTFAVLCVAQYSVITRKGKLDESKVKKTVAVVKPVKKKTLLAKNQLGKSKAQKSAAKKIENFAKSKTVAKAKDKLEYRITLSDLDSDAPLSEQLGWKKRKASSKQRVEEAAEDDQIHDEMLALKD